jgi:hypothetical protein
MSQPSLPRIYQRLLVYALFGVAGLLLLRHFWFFSLGSRTENRWALAAYADGWTATVFGPMSWACARWKPHLARAWLRAAATALVVFTLSPAGLAVFQGLAVSLFLLVYPLLGKPDANLVGSMWKLTAIVVLFGAGYVWILADLVIAAIGRRSEIPTAKARQSVGASRMMRIPGVLIVAVFGVTFAVAFNNAEPQATDGAPPGFSYDQSPADLWMDRAHFRVPRAYIGPWMSSKKMDDGRIVAVAIAIFALLPDFAMISPENAECFKNMKTCDGTVFIMLSEGNLVPIEQRSLGLYTKSRDALRQGPDGLLIYDDDSHAGPIENFGQELDGQLLPIWCDRVSGFCNFSGQLVLGVRFDAQFRRTRLAQWREIHRGVDALLGGFVAR